MSGITIKINTSGLGELIERMETIGDELREAMEDILAEQAIEFNQDLRGGGPGQGITPFKTGRLLTSGDIEQDGLNLAFVNDADYASDVHKSGGNDGDYERESGEAFNKRFGDELIELWDAKTEEILKEN